MSAGIQTPALFLLALLIGVHPIHAQSGMSAEAELRAVMAQIKTAALQGDAETTASLMTNEYLQTDISGYVQNKEEWFDDYFNPIASLIKAGKFRWETYERKNLQFRIYGDSAIVVGDLEAKGVGAKWMPQTQSWQADPNASFSGTLRFTHVYVKRDGHWLLAALHNAVPVATTPAK
ncbi:nuclear transport factor 2 family protein [Occallatibacter savannae]|uniref:nuclear transport factor 2 family protein n=1 Tax=Occallatibacter savannae TaxID=1002691 RepID=UPI0013A55DA0|nr:nuclear transport factor 2 family protein [Occallatibacter savannae]